MDDGCSCFLVAGFIWLLLALMKVARFLSGYFAGLFIVVSTSPIRCYSASLPWLIVSYQVFVVGASFSSVVCCKLVCWGLPPCNISLSVYLLGWASCTDLY